MEEMLYLPPDKRGRPILLYRSSLHKPGNIDPVAFTRCTTPLYRGTSLIRNSAPLGPYSRTMPRALWWS